MALFLRTPTDADWRDILKAAQAAAPWAGEENLVWLRNRQRFDLQVWRRRHYVVEDTVTGQVVAYGGVEEGPQPGAFRVFVVMDPERLIGGTGQHLYDRLRADLGELGACAAWVREEAQDLPLLSFFAEQGFVETRRAILADGMDFVVMELRLLGDLS